ncbi:MAG: type II/IV secretion system ATPase subunit [Thaumarchaeota archaeon]|nr:type II/IV secretion system ATPase subunit [Nitrososphaerota archaeon]
MTATIQLEKIVDNCNPLAIRIESCQLYTSLSKEFQEASAKNIHLLAYLHGELSKGESLPNYVVQLSRDMKKIENYNFIYPVGDPLFVNLCSNPAGGRAIYSIIQPAVPPKTDALFDMVEEALAYVIDEKHDFETPKEQEKILLDLLHSTVLIDDSLSEVGQHKVQKRKKGFNIINVNKETMSVLEYALINEKIGMGIIEPLMRDPYLEDISCRGVGTLFIEHKVFGSCESTIEFAKDEPLDHFVMKMSERIGRPVNIRRPIVDATLPDGSRINIVYSRDVSRNGTNFTIRKFSDIPISATQLIQWGTFDSTMAAYLWMMLNEGMSIWVSGETASGKTTTLRAVTEFINPNAKIVSIEDTPEVQVPHENWIREVTRDSEEAHTSIDIFDLIKAALRQRPNYIIVGEIRGKEGNIAFQAMQTGHPVMATFHASSIEKLIQRLTGSPIEVPKVYVDNLNLALVQGAVRIPQTGRLERRVLSINEIAGYDQTENRFDFVEMFSWDPSSDTFTYRGAGSSFLMEEKIGPMRGVDSRDMSKLYDEMKSRAEILERLAKMGVTNYWDLWRSIKTVSKLGVDRSLNLLKAGQKL